jgi:hypothetical protein
MIKKHLILCIITVAFLTFNPIQGQSSQIFQDDFNGSSLNPAWSFRSRDITGWNYSVSGGKLIVSDMYTNENGKWVVAILSRSLPQLADFRITTTFSWDSENNAGNGAMNGLLITLNNGKYDPYSHPPTDPYYPFPYNSIAVASYDDAWVGAPGEKNAVISDRWEPGYFYRSGIGSMPLAGEATLEMERTNGHIVIKWDGVQILSANDSTPVSEFALIFQYFPLYNSFFGTESVDFVKVEGNIVPVPGAVVLLGSGLLILVFYKQYRPAKRTNL